MCNTDLYLKFFGESLSAANLDKFSTDIPDPWDLSNKLSKLLPPPLPRKHNNTITLLGY